MKNLSVLKEHHHKVKSVIDICHLNDGIQESTVSLSEDGSLFKWDVWEQELSGSEWFRVNFVNDRIICISREGAIASINPKSGEWEILRKFNNGILDGRWSPGTKVLALITITENETEDKNCVLMTLSTDFDVLKEVILEPFDIDAQVTIVWKPDGTILAVNSLDKSDNNRSIRSYQRESLVLKYFGRSNDKSEEFAINLKAPIAWACGDRSNLIASIDYRSKQHQQVVFLDSHCSCLDEFSLKLSFTTNFSVKSICWNARSDILAVILKQEDGSSQLQLWNRSNSHWYLKCEWQYKEDILCVKFHTEHSYRLFVTFDEEIREYICCWDVGSYLAEDSFTAYTINGKSLNISTFHEELVPSFVSKFVFDHCVRSVSFNGSVSVVYLSDGGFMFFSRKSRKENDNISTKLNSISQAQKETITWDSDIKGIDIQTLRHIVIVKIKESHLYIIAAAPCNWLVEIKICLVKYQATILNRIMMENSILRIINWSDCPTGALIELEDGEFLDYSDTGIFPSSIERLLEPCHWIAGFFHMPVTNPQHNNVPRTRLIVGLSLQSNLYCCDRLLADSVSSFLLSTAHQFLYFVKSQSNSQLRGMSLMTLYNFNPFSETEENDIEDHGFCDVDQGARLVAILPGSPVTIVQTPYGNFERIHPRSLVIPFVISKIELGQYTTAVSTMRHYKIDLNFLLDINPLHFLQGGVVQFLEEIRQVDILNFFIWNLQNIDVTTSRYKVPSWFKRTRGIDEMNALDIETKVNSVCLRLRELFIQAEGRGSTLGGTTVKEGYYLQPILSTFARESPPNLENALHWIRESAMKEVNVGSKRAPLFSERTQISIQYLAFLTDYEQLFNTSLGMYDYELARAVVQNSQMDSELYIPLLKRLEELPEFLGKFEVDIDLKRFESALSNLHKSVINKENTVYIKPSEIKNFGNSFIRCLELVEEHKLHCLGLQLYKHNREEQSQIMESLGRRLLHEGKAKAALSVFLSVRPPNIDRAKQVARKCGDWRRFFSLSSKFSSETSGASNAQLAHEIASEIISGKSGASRRNALIDASRILLDYGSDIVGAIDLLTSAEAWKEARRIATQNNRDDLVEGVVDAAVSYASTLLVDFEERQSTFENSSLRYVEVLKIHKQARKESISQKGEIPAEASETTSQMITTTGSIRSSGNVTLVASVSNATSAGNQSIISLELDKFKYKSKINSRWKNNRKGQESVKVKPGSDEELESLVVALEVACVKPDLTSIINDTMLFLSQTGHIDQSRQLFDSYETLRVAIESCQTKRTKEAALEKFEIERKMRREGIDKTIITLECEAKVDALRCKELSVVLHELFSFL
mmetsp:Transcript_34330/g.39105  ORF Transcript_34330/g.39105 Transcript_34330/m.39105 type:complete len:1329 (+) Transcript_34330:71-4057(+)